MRNFILGFMAVGVACCLSTTAVAATTMGTLSGSFFQNLLPGGSHVAVRVTFVGDLSAVDDLFLTLQTDVARDDDSYELFDNVSYLLTPTGFSAVFNVSHFCADYCQTEHPGGLYLEGVTDHAIDYTLTIQGVPEPATWALMIGGFAVAGAGLRRRRAATA